MSPVHRDSWFDPDEDRQRLFVFASLLVISLFCLYLVLVDPAWRVLHREGLLASPKAENGWVEIDRQLVRELEAAPTAAIAGQEDLERALVTEVARRRQAAAPTLPPVVEWPELRTVAREMAAQRGLLAPGETPRTASLRHPALLLALRFPDRLLSSTALDQPLDRAQAQPQFAAELVGGWLNRTRVRQLLFEGRDVSVAVGAVAEEGGQVVVQLLLVDTVARLSNPLPTVVSLDTTVTANFLLPSGDSGELPDLYLKGPEDPGFSPVGPPGPAGGTSFPLDWHQGAGGYLLRASHGERLSDPRPVLVQ
jgi:hypothetical protein